MDVGSCPPFKAFKGWLGGPLSFVRPFFVLPVLGERRTGDSQRAGAQGVCGSQKRNPGRSISKESQSTVPNKGTRK